MAKDYVKENEGTGFQLDDDDDFESMLADAGAAGESNVEGIGGDSGVDSLLESRTSSGLRESSVRLPGDEAKPAPKVEAAPEPEIPLIEDEPAPLKATPREEPKEIIAGPAEPPLVAKPRAPLNIRSEADDIEQARRVLATVDVYRTMTTEVKRVVSQFLDPSRDFTEDEAEIAVRAMNADQVLFDTMKALRESKELDAVGRAFYVLGLPPLILENLCNLVAAFTSVEIDTHKDKLVYVRELVETIQELDKRAIEYVKATEQVLSAARAD